MGTPCFADRMNLLFELIVRPPDPDTGRSEAYTVADLAHAIPRKPGTRTPAVAASRLAKLRRHRDTSPSVDTADIRRSFHPRFHTPTGEAGSESAPRGGGVRGYAPHVI